MNLTKLILHKFPAEFVHGFTLESCRALDKIPLFESLLCKIFRYENPCLCVKLGNLEFPNPIGLAAGFDKNGVAVSVLQALGFGFIEVGTITPEQQLGNPKPRLFRLKKDFAVINRMGFNNCGAFELKKNLERTVRKVPIGVNIGKNKKTPIDTAHTDYQKCLEITWNCADYFTINISSPNTEDLRSIQHEKQLKSFLKAVIEKREQLQQLDGSHKQLWLKIAPDLSDPQIEFICETAISLGIDALVVSNTTISRPELKSKHQNESGGLSGKPLFDKSNQVLEKVHSYCKEKIPLVAVGGIFTADDVLAKLHLGAKLVQIYTGLIFEGPGMINQLKKELVKRIETKNLSL